MKNSCKEEADKLFTKYHNIIQDKGGDCGEECLVSILAIDCAKEEVKGIQKELQEIEDELLETPITGWLLWWESVIKELDKL